jgi:hypothetical protein
MIDTDKYEGHTEGPWMWYREDGDVDLVVANDQCRTVLEEVKALYSEANENLIADAPLLLAEVKRLRMIDTDKYEGCQTSRLILHKGLLCPTIFMDVDGSGEIVPTLDRGIVRVIPDTPEHYLQLLQDAPLLLQTNERQKSS